MRPLGHWAQASASSDAVEDIKYFPAEHALHVGEKAPENEPEGQGTHTKFPSTIVDSSPPGHDAKIVTGSSQY